MDKTELAIEKLHALSQIPGALRIITNEHACGGGLTPSAPGFDEAVCDAYEFDMKSPKHFVIHDVVSIEPVGDTGRYRAYTLEGDWCESYPEALLKRLEEANQAGA